MSDAEKIPPPDSDDDLPVLPYEPRGAEPPAWIQPYAKPWHFCVAAVATAALLMVTVPLSILAAFLTTGDNPGPAGPIVALGIIGVVLLGLIWRAVSMGRRPWLRGYAMGIWIGIGVAALLEGLCFASMK